MEPFAKVEVFLMQPPSCPSDILPPEGAGNDCGATTSLAPSGERDRGIGGCS